MLNVRFKWEEEYLDYMKKNFPKNEGIYNRLNSNQKKAIMDYFRWRTKTYFSEICSSVKLEVSPEKVRKIAELADGANDWVFDGIVDLGSKCGKCTLGHALRYEHYAYSPSTNNRILFGSKCVSDFFNVAPAVIRQMDRVRKETFEDVKRTLFIYYSGKSAAYKELNYSKFPKPMMLDPKVDELLVKRFGSGSDILLNVMRAGLPVPQYFVDIIRNFEANYAKTARVYELIDSLPEHLRAYATRCAFEPDVFKPYNKYPKSVNFQLHANTLRREPLEKFISIGSSLSGEIDYYSKSLGYKDLIANYRKCYFVGNKDKKRPAYKNEIEKQVPTLSSEYMFYLPIKEMMAISSIIWLLNGNIQALRCAYPRARSKSFVTDKLLDYDVILELEPVIAYGMDILKDKNKLDRLMDSHSLYVDGIVAKNNTISESNFEYDTDKELTAAWKYLNDNIDKVSVPGIVDMLKKYNDCNRLSEKQANWVKNVYNKMIADEEKSTRRELIDTKSSTRLFIRSDSNNSRCAIINSNDFCKPIKARKFLPNSYNEILEMFDYMDTSQISYVMYDGNSERMCKSMLKKRSDIVYNRNLELQERGESTVPFINPSSREMVYNIDDVKAELGFSDPDLLKYARSIFEEEGVIDNFLKETTLLFLKYRKDIRTGIK